MKSIGEEIRGVIKKKGISLYQVAKDLGITWESLYRSLLDKANPKWNRIQKILNYLDYEVVIRPKTREGRPYKPKLPQPRRKKEGVQK